MTERERDLLTASLFLASKYREEIDLEGEPVSDLDFEELERLLLGEFTANLELIPS